MGSFGPRADKAHFTPNDIDNLRNFVQSQFPDNFSNSGHTLISFFSPNGTRFLLCVLVHRPKLEQQEILAVFSYPFLAIENRTGRI